MSEVRTASGTDPKKKRRLSFADEYGDSLTEVTEVTNNHYSNNYDQDDHRGGRDSNNAMSCCTISQSINAKTSGATDFECMSQIQYMRQACTPLSLVHKRRFASQYLFDFQVKVVSTYRLEVFGMFCYPLIFKIEFRKRYTQIQFAFYKSTSYLSSPQKKTLAIIVRTTKAMKKNEKSLVICLI